MGQSPRSCARTPSASSRHASGSRPRHPPASAGTVTRRGHRSGGALERAGAGAVAGASALQAGAAASGAAANRALSSAASPLARAPAGSRRRRAHAATADAAQSASRTVAQATALTRSSVESAANLVARAGGGSSDARGLGNLALSAFEAAASAPVFVQHVLYSANKPGYVAQQVMAAGNAVAHGRPPKLLKPQKLLKPPRPHGRPPKFTHHWQNGQWVPIVTAVDQNGRPYRPPTGYPVARGGARPAQGGRK